MQTIVTYPNNILRAKAKPVPLEEITRPRIQKLIATMKETLRGAQDGIGLAAPQIGESLRIFLVSEEALAIDRGETENGKQKKQWNAAVFINPEIKKMSSQKTDVVEGCLSVPGKFGVVSRPEKITVEWLDEFGVKHARGASKFFSRVIQHETDHINGVLFIDKTKKFIEVGEEKIKI